MLQMLCNYLMQYDVLRAELDAQGVQGLPQVLQVGVLSALKVAAD
jgi:hypothetical protein